MITDLRIVAGVVLVLWVLACLKWPKHAWRWHSGHTHDRYHHTDATWTRPATKVLHPTGHAVRWHHMPRLTRAAIRTGFSWFALTMLLGAMFTPWVTLILLGVLLAAAAVLGVPVVHRKVRRWLPL